jgi:hypothetical protein
VDSALEEVFEELLAQDPTGVRMATTIRNTLDQLYDGQHTGRYRGHRDAGLRLPLRLINYG